MPPKKLDTGLLSTVGAAKSDGITELIGPNGMLYVTPETKIEPGTPLRVGHKILVDAQRDLQLFGTDRGRLAVRIRPISADPSDVKALQMLLTRLANAGLDDPGFGDPHAFLTKLLDERVRSGDNRPLSLPQELVKQLESKGRRFPMDSWQHDIEPAVDDMESLLAMHGVTTQLPRAPIQAVFERHADEANDQVARAHFCTAIASEANLVLEHAGRSERWSAFARLPWEDAHEPFWLLVTPDQRAGLLREKIFK